MKGLALLLAATIFSAAPAQLGTVSVGDVVVVAVSGMPDYTTETAVLADGTISGVGFGRIKVVGLNPDQARNAIRVELMKKLKDPAVSFYIKTPAPRFVYVAGVDQTERQFVWRPGLTLRQLVSLVGLPQESDKLEARIASPGKDAREFDLQAVLAGDRVGDQPIQPGDTLLLSPIPFVRVWVTGFVEKPGQLRVDKGSDATQAVAAAGGTKLNAVAAATTLLPSELTISVRRPGISQPIPKDSVLQDGDVIAVEVPGLVRVTVGGEVVRPGEFVLREGATLEAAVATAGGLKAEGTTKGLVVMRGQEMIQPTSSSAFQLRSGDLVVARPTGDYVYVMGEVLQPGRYLFEEDEAMNAVGALAKAKGLRPSGTNRRVVHVTVGEDGKYVAKQFNLDEFLKDGKVEANPSLKPGDLLFFTTPKGINPAQVLQVASSLYFFDRIIREN